MGLINCPDCGRQVSSTAPTCPNCGRPIKPQTVKTKQASGCTAWGCLGVIAILVIGAVGSSMDQSPPATPPNPNSATNAEAMCRVFVEQRLKAPRTARFVVGSRQSEQVDSVTWRVTGEVDAENSFGAMLRNTYQCRLKYVGGPSERWEAVSVTVD